MSQGRAGAMEVAGVVLGQTPVPIAYSVRLELSSRGDGHPEKSFWEELVDARLWGPCSPKPYRVTHVP